MSHLFSPVGHAGRTAVGAGTTRGPRLAPMMPRGQVAAAAPVDGEGDGDITDDDLPPMMEDDVVHRGHGS